MTKICRDFAREIVTRSLWESMAHNQWRILNTLCRSSSNYSSGLQYFDRWIYWNGLLTYPSTKHIISYFIPYFSVHISHRILLHFSTSGIFGNGSLRIWKTHRRHANSSTPYLARHHSWFDLQIHEFEIDPRFYERYLELLSTSGP